MLIWRFLLSFFHKYADDPTIIYLAKNVIRLNWNPVRKIFESKLLTEVCTKVLENYTDVQSSWKFFKAIQNWWSCSGDSHLIKKVDPINRKRIYKSANNVDTNFIKIFILLCRFHFKIRFYLNNIRYSHKSHFQNEKLNRVIF